MTYQIGEVNILETLKGFRLSVIRSYNSQAIGCITMEQQRQGIDILYKRTYNANLSKTMSTEISCLDNCYETFLKKDIKFLESCYIKSVFINVQRFAAICLNNLIPDDSIN